MVALVHWALALALFLIVNWVGRHSFTFGYLQLSVVSQSDEAPAFNIVFRVVAPLVFVVVASALLYRLGADRFVENIYLVVAYYVLFRWGFNVALGRHHLLHWTRDIAVGFLSTGAAYLLYDAVLQQRRALLPDLSTVANELWIL